MISLIRYFSGVFFPNPVRAYFQQRNASSMFAINTWLLQPAFAPFLLHDIDTQGTSMDEIVINAKAHLDGIPAAGDKAH